MVHSICRAPRDDTGERVGDGHAEVVVAVRRPDHLVAARNLLAQTLDQGVVLLGHGVADGVGNVNGGGALLDGQLAAAIEHVPLGAGGVLGAPLDVVGVLAGARHTGADGLDHLLGIHLQLPLAMHGAGGDERVDARLLGEFHGLAGAVDVGEARAGQAADDGVLHQLGDFAHRLEVAVGGDREAGLDDVDAHLVEQFGNLQLVLERHGGARRLLAVAQRGVEDDDPVLRVLVGIGRNDGGGVVLAFGVHWFGLSFGHASLEPARKSQLVRRSPERPSRIDPEPRRLRGW